MNLSKKMMQLMVAGTVISGIAFGVIPEGTVTFRIVKVGKRNESHAFDAAGNDLGRVTAAEAKEFEKAKAGSQAASSSNSSGKRSRSPVRFSEEPDNVVIIPGRDLTPEQVRVNTFFQGIETRLDSASDLTEVRAIQDELSGFAALDGNKQHIRDGRVDELEHAINSKEKSLRRQSPPANTPVANTRTQEEILIDVVIQANNEHITLQDALKAATGKAQDIQDSLKALQDTYKQYRSEEKASKHLIANAALMRDVADQQIKNNNEIQKLHGQISKAFAYYVKCEQALDAYRRANVNLAENQVLNAMGYVPSVVSTGRWAKVRALFKR